MNDAKREAVLKETFELLFELGADNEDISKIGFALSGAAIGEMSRTREDLEKNIAKYIGVFKEVVRRDFMDPEEN